VWSATSQTLTQSACRNSTQAPSPVHASVTRRSATPPPPHVGSDAKSREATAEIGPGRSARVQAAGHGELR